MRAVLLLLVALAVPACGSIVGPDNPRVDFRTDRTSYRIGEEGVLSLTNRHSGPIGHGEFLCPLMLQRRVQEQEDWEVVPWRFEIVCLAILLNLHPGETYALTFTISEDLFEPGGEYRYVTNVEDIRSGVASAKFSRPFVVEE